MAKKSYDRSFGAVLADVRDLQERFGHVAHFLRMAEHLFEAIEGDNPNLKRVAAKVKEAYQAAKDAVEPSEK